MALISAKCDDCCRECEFMFGVPDEEGIEIMKCRLEEEHIEVIREQPFDEEDE